MKTIDLSELKFDQPPNRPKPQRLTDEWEPYTGEYNKVPYAIRLKDGREFDWAWPNAGMFLPDGGERIPLADVTHVKRGRDWYQAVKD